jgi:hypothetical protein
MIFYNCCFLLTKRSDRHYTFWKACPCMKYFHCKYSHITLSMTGPYNQHLTQNRFSLLPTVALIAYDTLVSHPVTLRVPYLTAQISQLAKDITKFPWDDMRQGRISGDSIISSIREKEILICRANSLLRKVTVVAI